MEGAYAAPVIQIVNDRFLCRTGMGEEDLTTLVNMLSWLLHGFFTGGLVRLDGTVLEWHEADARVRFRGEMHRLVDRLGAPVSGQAALRPARRPKKVPSPREVPLT